MTKADVSLKGQNTYPQSEDQNKCENIVNTNPELDEMLRKIEKSVKVSKDKEETRRLFTEARALTLNLRATKNQQKTTKPEPFSIEEQVMTILCCKEEDIVTVLTQQAAQLEEAKKKPSIFDRSPFSKGER